jgi:hypothetical protein
MLFMVIAPVHTQTNPLWHTQKVKNYLPHMTWPEVEDEKSGARAKTNSHLRIFFPSFGVRRQGG